MATRSTELPHGYSFTTHRDDINPRLWFFRVYRHGDGIIRSGTAYRLESAAEAGARAAIQRHQGA